MITAAADRHNGSIDSITAVYALETSAKAKATAPGKVSFIGRWGSYGKSVFVDHGYGIQTRYAHLSIIFVKEGKSLLLWQPIGKIGNTGRSTGKHLHYEIKINKKSMNPRPFLREGKNVSKKY